MSRCSPPTFYHNCRQIRWLLCLKRRPLQVMRLREHVAMLKLNEAVLAAAAAAAAAAGDTSLRYDCGYEGGPVCAPS